MGWLQNSETGGGINRGGGGNSDLKVITMCSPVWLLPALSAIPTELCLITPGFVPNTLTTEIIISDDGDFVIPCLNGIFCQGVVVKEVVSYTLHCDNAPNTAVILHDLSVPLCNTDQKTFVLVPVTCIRNCLPLDSEHLDFFTDLLQVCVPDHQCNPFMLTVTSHSVALVNSVEQYMIFMEFTIWLNALCNRNTSNYLSCFHFDILITRPCTMNSFCIVSDSRSCCNCSTLLTPPTAIVYSWILSALHCQEVEAPHPGFSLINTITTWLPNLFE